LTNSIPNVWANTSSEKKVALLSIPLHLIQPCLIVWNRLNFLCSSYMIPVFPILLCEFLHEKGIESFCNKK
jgi:hypothetical protein